MVSMTSSDGTVVVTCQATHLTSFAVLVDVAGSFSGVCTLIHRINHYSRRLVIASQMHKKTFSFSNNIIFHFKNHFLL